LGGSPHDRGNLRPGVRRARPAGPTRRSREERTDRPWRTHGGGCIDAATRGDNLSTQQPTRVDTPACFRYRPILNRGCAIRGGVVFRVCAWCGLDLGRVPPHEDRAVSHGICARCAVRVRTGRESPPTPLPPGHVLLVVARRAQPLYWHLSRAFEDLAG